MRVHVSWLNLGKRMKTRISCMRDSLLLLRWGRESVATGVTCVDGDLRMRFLVV